MKKKMSIVIILMMLITSLGFGASLSGIVSDADTNAPIEGVALTLFTANTGGGPGGGHHQDSSNVVLETMSDENGSYTFNVDVEGRYHLTAHTQGYHFYSDDSLDINGDVILDISLTAHWAPNPSTGEFTLSGVVLDSINNTPISGAMVALHSNFWNHDSTAHDSSQNDSANYYWGQTFTDDEGNYSFEYLEAGDYRLNAHTYGYAFHHTDISLTGDMTVDILLSEQEMPWLGYTVSGTITDETTGEAIAYAEVRKSINEHWLPLSYADGNGYYTYFADGDISIQISASGYSSQNFDLNIEDDTTYNYALTQETYEGELFGVITDSETDLALAGIEISIFGFVHGDSSHSGGNHGPGNGHNWENYSSTTDGNGYYSFSNLPESEISIWIQYPSYEYYSESVDIDGETEYNIALSPLPGQGIISGNVSYDTVGGPASAMIFLVEEDGCGHGHGWVTTDEMGNYEVSVPAGDYYVGVIAGGNRGNHQNPGADSSFYYFEYYDDASYIEDATLVSVDEDGEIQNINFGIPASGDDVLTAMVHGIITDNSNQALANVEVTLYDQSGNNVGTVWSNENGAYSISDLVIGENYNLSVSSNDLSTNSQYFEQSEMISVVNVQLNSVLAVDDVEIPSELTLEQNYPNPFNPYTTISFSLPQAEKVQILIYDIRGNRVAELTNMQYGMGHHSITWDGSEVSSGIYFYSLISGNEVQTQKMLLTK